MNLQTIKHYAKSYLSYIGQDYRLVTSRGAGTEAENLKHLEDAITWLFNAQDATPDDGVSRSYGITYIRHFSKQGWVSSYPETTGYIIPTLNNAAKVLDLAKAADRAAKMANWESEIQLETGAVKGGIVGEGSSPAIFNTGQVIFGWLDDYRKTGSEQSLSSAVRAGEFLCQMQDEDGSWRKSTSKHTGNDQIEYRVYNVRSAWALLALGLELNNQEFIKKAKANLDFCLGLQLENGWFPNNCLTDPANPLLHTIAYTLRGITEMALLLKDDSILRNVKAVAQRIAGTRREDLGFAGRFDKDWNEASSWSCLTGEAQMAIVWGKLGVYFNDENLLKQLSLTNQRLKNVQLNFPSRKGLHGGITGSEPVDGDYGCNEVLNWAVKFFADSLMLEMIINKDTSSIDVTDIS